MRTGTELITFERIRQKRASNEGGEGYTSEHDDYYRGGELALAAACYAAPHKIYIHRTVNNGHHFTDPWPWPWEKHGQYAATPDQPEINAATPALPEITHKRIKELAKAGALIAAEIDRLQRTLSE